MKHSKLHNKFQNKTFVTIYICWLRNKVPFQKNLINILYRFLMGSVQFFHPNSSFVYSFVVFYLSHVCVPHGLLFPIPLCILLLVNPKFNKLIAICQMGENMRKRGKNRSYLKNTGKYKDGVYFQNVHNAYECINTKNNIFLLNREFDFILISRTLFEF